MTSAETMNTGLRRRSRQASDHSERGRSSGPEPSGPAGVLSSVSASSTPRSMAPPMLVPAMAASGSS